MAQRSRVPAFGNWESEGNVPYTVFFDKARKGRGGGPIRNPNDPEEYPEMFTENSQEAPPIIPKVVTPTPPPAPTPTPAPKPMTHERRQSREYANSPGHRENPGRRPSGPEYSIDRSPLHRRARASGRESPMVDKSFDGGYDNRGKTRMRPLQRDDAPQGTAVPKFGSWDVSNPASADGFTHIFGKVREERMTPSQPQPQPLSSPSPYNNVNNRKFDDNVKVSCFPCLRGK